MAERIVSPGVFTRERDLSFLPQGISEIGAAIIGPTVKGPAFTPTVISSFDDYVKIFGGYDSKYYTPFTVKNYLDYAGTVTIVKVGYLGGYKVTGFNLVVSGATVAAASATQSNQVVATFLPAMKNNDGEGSISGAVSPTSATNFSLTINGANATASISGLTAKEIGSVSGVSDAKSEYIAKKLTTNPNAPTLSGTETPAYMYKFFRTNISASFANGYYNSGSVISVESQEYDFSSGTETIDSNNVTTITGNVDAASARTPFIQSQLTGNSRENLFRIYMRSAGTDTNFHYAIIRDIKKPQNSNKSNRFAQFGISIYQVGRISPIEEFDELNLDPDSPNFIAKVIGDEFSTVNNDGEITVYGNYPNLSQYIRVGDYDEEMFFGNPNLQPMGFAAVVEPITASAAVPTASFVHNQTLNNDNTNSGTYDASIPYGWKIDSRFREDEYATNIAYHAPIPASADNGNNVSMSLEEMNGYGSADSKNSEYNKDNNFVTSSSALTIDAPAKQLKFSVPFQFGFDGINPGKEKKTGKDISTSNTSGFDCSTVTASGSVAYKRAINAISNPDDYDINMLVTPGIIHKHHSVVSNHAIDKVEARADAFYVMDGNDIDDSVATAVDNIKSLDTNYVATYYPWVQMEDPSKSSGTILVPPSVVIPGVIAFTDSVAHEWFAPAGLNRGGLTNVRMTKKKLTHTDRDTLYEGRVNPIASFPGQGVVVFGQKTLQARPSALDRINVRRLLIRLKKFIASSSRFLVFEQNDSSTRSRFLNIVNPFLESVQSNSGLSAFKVVMDDSNNTPDVIDRNQLVGQIFIQPTRTAEFIVLDFSVLPTGAAFPE